MRKIHNRKGQGLVEYVLILVLMALLTLGGIRLVGKKTHNAFVQAGTALQDEMNYANSNGSSEKAL